MSAAVPRMIAVDFDGTINEFAYPGTGGPKQGVKEALTRLRALGFHIIIYSCRGCKWYPEIFSTWECGESAATPVPQRRVFKLMKAWLDEHEIPYDSIDDGSLGKPMCDYYIDDKGIRFQNNWEEIANAIETVTLARGVVIDSPTHAALPGTEERSIRWVANR